MRETYRTQTSPEEENASIQKEVLPRIRARFPQITIGLGGEQDEGRNGRRCSAVPSDHADLGDNCCRIDPDHVFLHTSHHVFIPMAISLAYGVLFATVITLLLVPALYMIIDDLFGWDTVAQGQKDDAVIRKTVQTEKSVLPTSPDAS